MVKERYRIKGKIYYKIEEVPVKECDQDLISDIWKMQNPKGETFKLLIKRYGNKASFALYEDTDKAKQVCKTYSISKVER